MFSDNFKIIKLCPYGRAVKGACRQWVHVVTVVHGFVFLVATYVKDILSQSTKSVTRGID